MMTNYGNISENILLELLHIIGFNSLTEYKKYMLSKAKLNEYGAICHNEKRQNYQLNYSNNCKLKFGIGGNLNGTFRDYRFN